MIHTRRRLFAWGGTLLGTVAAAALLPAQAARAAGKVHRVVIQVNDNDPARMALALNNVANISTYYTGKGEEVEIELVAYGPGLHLLRDDTSPLKDRVKSIAEGIPNMSFAACGNTRANMQKAEGKEIPLLPQAKIVPAGVTRIMDLQEAGWSYIKP